MPEKPLPTIATERSMRSYITVTYGSVTCFAMAPRMTGTERREQLLDATKAIVVADGFHAVSIEGVARAAGITRPIVYGHFEDLGGLLERLVEREARRALGPLPGAYDDLLGALTADLNPGRADPPTGRPRPRPPGGAPRRVAPR